MATSRRRAIQDMTSFATAREEALEFIYRGEDKPGCVEKDVDSIIGKGLFAEKTYQKGEFIVEYAGDLISRKEGLRREKSYPLRRGSYIYFFAWDSKKYCLDATRSSRKGRFANDAGSDDVHRNATVKCIPGKGKPHLALFAIREIQIGEEIRYDYGVPDLPWRNQLKECRAPVKKLPVDIGKVVSMSDLVQQEGDLETEQIIGKHHQDIIGLESQEEETMQELQEEIVIRGLPADNVTNGLPEEKLQEEINTQSLPEEGVCFQTMSSVKSFDNYQQLLSFIEELERETTTRYITQRLSNKVHFSLQPNDVTSLKGHKILWKDCQKTVCPSIDFDGIPYINIGWMVKECHQGPNSQRVKGRRKQKQLSNKQACPAAIRIRVILKFPEFMVDSYDNSWMKRKISRQLKPAFAERETMQKDIVYILSYPCTEDHKCLGEQYTGYIELPTPKSPEMHVSHVSVPSTHDQHDLRKDPTKKKKRSSFLYSDLSGRYGKRNKTAKNKEVDSDVVEVQAPEDDDVDYCSADGDAVTKHSTIHTDFINSHVNRVVTCLKEIMNCTMKNCEEVDHRRHHQFIENPVTMYEKLIKKYCYGEKFISPKVMEYLHTVLSERMSVSKPVHGSIFTRYRSYEDIKNQDLEHIFTEYPLMGVHYMTLVLHKEALVSLICKKTGLPYEEVDERCSQTERSIQEEISKL